MIPVLKESLVYIIPVSLAAGLLFLLRCWGAGVVALVFAALLLFFFRDPEREIPGGKGLIVAPADGKVIRVSAPGGEEGEGLSISIFLSLLDVHVNRSPVNATVSDVTYRKGSFRLAFLDESSRENEQNIISFRRGQDQVTMKQIAGLIARRVVCWVKPGEEVQAGQRIGFIKFGSRVDLILPPGCRIDVREGDRVKGGVTVMGRLG